MKKIPYEEFERLYNPITFFQEECSAVNDALNVIFPSSFVIAELGGRLLESYMELLEQHLDIDDWLSWFTFENEGGKGELEAGEKDLYVKIKCLEDLYNFLSKE